MTQQAQQDWDDEDFELEIEFADVTRLTRLNKSKPPRVPGKLDRLIRKHAMFSASEKLVQNWLLSPAMQLVLVTLLIFSIAVMYAVMPSSQRQEGENPTTLADPIQQSTLQLKDKSLRGSAESSVTLSFIVNDTGHAQQIAIIDRCHRTFGSTACKTTVSPENKARLDNFAIRQIQSRVYPASEKRTESVFVP